MILSIPMLLIGTLMMAAIHVAFFKALPNFLRKVLCYNLFLGALCDFCMSSVILLFTGIGNAIGFLNLLGSCVFGGYLFVYRKKHEITKMRLKWRYGIVPSIEIGENNYEHWLF